MVAVAFLQAAGVIGWCKSERREKEGLQIRLALFPYDTGLVDVQVNFSVGRGGCRWRSVVPSPQYAPRLLAVRELRTGVIEEFAVVEGEPAVGLFVLLVARRDVKSGRNGLWRLRPELVNSVPEPFSRSLTYGRTGTLTAEPSAAADPIRDIGFGSS